MLSIIVPVFNEHASLSELHAQIATACDGVGQDWELLFVDDGSTDGSWGVIGELAREDPAVGGLRFRRNFGKAAALAAGLQATRGEIIFTLDADLQDNPTEIPRFLTKLGEGYDLVNGWKIRRLDPWHKTKPSKVFNWMVSRLTGLALHDHNCGYKCFRREVARELSLYGERHRFIPALAHARGFRVTEIDVHHRARPHGHSKYGLRRFHRGFLDLLTVRYQTTHGSRPMHLLGGMALLAVVVGLLALGVLGLRGLFAGGPLQRVDALLLTLGVGHLVLAKLLFALGWLAELLIANPAHRPADYSIAEQTRPPASG
jgi:glycosyltransferase involved in cell wall biosynthesis